MTETVRLLLCKPSREQQEVLDQHARWLVSSGAQGKRINSDVDDSEFLELSGLDLDGINLSEGLLEFTDFRRSSLKGACFRGADLGAANFGGADLRSADLSNADIHMTSFVGALLNGAKFDGAKHADEAFWTRRDADAFGRALEISLREAPQKRQSGIRSGNKGQTPDPS